MTEYAGAGWGIPSNDPEQRGDADGDGQRPGVNKEGFDEAYTEALSGAESEGNGFYGSEDIDTGGNG